MRNRISERLSGRDSEIVSMKQHYQADLLRTLANEDDNIIGLLGEGMVLDAMYGIPQVFHESSNAGLIVEETSFRSRR
jgi:hypothetical protein